MNGYLAVRALEDQRRFVRVPFTGTLAYRYMPEDNGTAHCMDVGRGGVRVSLGRYLRPGRYVLLTLPSDGEHGFETELKARVMWCRPTDAPHRFEAGVRVFHDEPEAVAAMSELLYEALAQAGVLTWTTPGSTGLGWRQDGRPSRSPFIASPSPEQDEVPYAIGRDLASCSGS